MPIYCIHTVVAVLCSSLAKVRNIHTALTAASGGICFSDFCILLMTDLVS